jgi:hypothetical protein
LEIGMQAITRLMRGQTVGISLRYIKAIIAALRASPSDARIAELLRLRAERTWQPIDKAPQDGTEFLGYWDNDDLHVVSIRAGQCYRQMDREAWAMPTLWMPLPELPDEARELAEILK